MAHADLQRGVTGRERWPPERIDEVDDSERKDNARTKNHENSCGQDALPFGNSEFGLGSATPSPAPTLGLAQPKLV